MRICLTTNALTAAQDTPSKPATRERISFHGVLDISRAIFFSQRALICSGSVVDEFSKPLQIYVVEDSPIIRRLLASKIEASGAELVGCSGSAQHAIAELSVLKPDLILIDISLESGTGFDVLRALQERGLLPGALKVVLTNHVNAQYKSLSFRLGASHFFDKARELSQALTLIHTLASARPRSNPHACDPDHCNPGNHRRN